MENLSQFVLHMTGSMIGALIGILLGATILAWNEQRKYKRFIAKAEESELAFEETIPNSKKEEKEEKPKVSKMNDARLRSEEEWHKIIDNVLDYKETHKIADKELFKKFNTTRDGLFKHSTDEQYDRWEKLKEACKTKARENIKGKTTLGSNRNRQNR